MSVDVHMGGHTCREDVLVNLKVNVCICMHAVIVVFMIVL